MAEQRPRIAPIGVDLRPLQAGFKAHFGRGIGRVAQEISRRLAQAAGDLPLVGLVQADLPQPGPEYLVNCPRYYLRWPWPRQKALDRLLGQELAQPWSLRGRFGLVHFQAHLDASAWSAGPTVVMLHDLIQAQHIGHLAPGGPARRLLRRLEARAARKARVVLTNSRATAQEVVVCLGVSPSKVVVIPLAASAHFRPATQTEVDPVKHRLDIPDSYFLFVGTFEPRKNVLRMIRAFGRVTQNNPGVCLLLVGGAADSIEARAVREAVRAQGLTEWVRFLGQVTERDLVALYSSALALVFPSLYEGFGLPALEAMACGSPVLHSRAGALPEVVGSAGLAFDPTDESQIEWAMAQILIDPGLPERLRADGLRRSALFSWDRSVGLVVQAYRDVLGARP